MTPKHMWMWGHWNMFGLIMLCCQEMLKLASGLPDPFSWEASASCARLSKVGISLFQPWEAKEKSYSVCMAYECSWSAFYFTLWLGYLSRKCCCFGVPYRTSYYLLQWLQDFKVVIYHISFTFIHNFHIYHPEIFWSCVAVYVCPLHVCLSPSVSLTYGSDILDSCRPDFKRVVKPSKSWKRPRQKIYWHWCSHTQKNHQYFAVESQRKMVPIQKFLQETLLFLSKL